jgi:hypothetical protein
MNNIMSEELKPAVELEGEFAAELEPAEELEGNFEKSEE